MPEYRTFLLDPPWPERGGGKIKRGADKHYALLNVKEMPRVILGSGVFTPAANAHLYMWVTNNYLPAGLWLGETLGFTYKTIVTWGKQRISIGQYFRGKTEHMLFFTRGRGLAPDVCTDSKSLSTLLENAQHDRKHSRKPVEAYELIEARSKGPRLEMFAREQRDGWERWGFEAPVTDGQEVLNLFDEAREELAADGVTLDADAMLEELQRDREETGDISEDAMSAATVRLESLG